MSIRKKVPPELRRKIKRAIAKAKHRDYPLPKNKMYEFDVQGYTILRDFIPTDTIAEMNRLIDENQKGEYPRKFPYVELGDIFMDVAQHPHIVRMAKYWSGPEVRLDHLQGLQSAPFEKSEFVQEKEDSYKLKESKNIHIETHTGFRYYWEDGRAQPGLLTFGLSLSQVKEGDGGLFMVPGSHKHHMDVTAHEVQDFHFSPDSSLLWVQPALNPGDLIVFTEALVHGTLPWTVAGRPRRILYYRYCPGHMCWRAYDEVEKYLPMATSQTLKDLLRPPYIASYQEDGIRVVNPTNDFRSSVQEPGK